MATGRSFNDMLNEYLPYKLLRAEFSDRSYIFKNIEKDNGWKMGQLIVPFEAALASSVENGSLTASDDIADYDYVRGYINTYPEAWGTMQFKQRDLMEHDGKIPETTFLRILPNQTNNFMEYMRFVLNCQMLNGPVIANLTEDGDTNGTGVADVDRIDRFKIGQKCYIYDSDTTAAAVYVTAIDVNNKRVTLSDSRGGSAYSISSFTEANDALLYWSGAQTAANRFSSVKTSLLSAANGGTTTLYNQTKTSYPYLQAWNQDGSDINATNVLAKIFKAVKDVKRFTPGKPTEVWMSYKHFGTIQTILEAQKGSFKTSEKQHETEVYAWDEVMIWGPGAKLKLVAMQEMDDDWIGIIDPGAMKLHSNGFFRKNISPDGNAYYVSRATTGYTYICDICFYGDLVVNKPSFCGIIHSVPDYTE